MPRSLPALLLALLAIALAAGGEAAAAPDGFPDIAGAKPVPIQALDGWAGDDHARALLTFQRTCVAIVDETEAIRSGQPVPADLAATCRAALAEGEADQDAARRFLETRFDAYEVPGPGVLTGYYEPDFEGSLTPLPGFEAALLARPDDLVTVAPGETVPGVPAGIVGARRTAAGFEPYPDRAAIEAGALGAAARPIMYLRDAVDVFIVQVQGSASIRLRDGRSVRVGFAGRNGQPYTSVARLLRERLGVAPEDMTADRLTEWLRANPAEGRALLRQNRSYVFFRIVEELTPGEGPVGAAGMPLTAGRSIAVDRQVWPYGLPVWIEAAVPVPSGAPEQVRRLTIAQDTGTAIAGAARADLFVGSGREAGERAGLIRSPVRFVVLWPKPATGSSPAKP